ncbi:hypothetical protein [Microbacterium sp.]|uniref:hypothetical protein n=1 Tax=Microbacterium sp. TaxID=51671 RepID=UPI003C754201
MTARKRRRPNIDPEVAAARARLAGLARAASQTPEELAASTKHAAKARWAKYRAEREAAGLPATKTPPKPQPSARALEYWLGVIDREQPEREWKSNEERRSAALLRAKQEAARAALSRAKGGADK